LDGSTQEGKRALRCRSFPRRCSGRFFEFIQRKGDDGFGEGNFKACSSRSSATSAPRRAAGHALNQRVASDGRRRVSAAEQRAVARVARRFAGSDRS